MKGVALVALALGAQPLDAAPPPAAPADLRLGDECGAIAAQPPFTRTYAWRGGGTVVFVAAHHEAGADSPTARQIKAAFDAHAPTTVLVEGVASKSDRPAYIAWLADRADKELKAGSIGEPLLAIHLAEAAHVPYRGWDDSPDEDYALAVADGFAPEDVLGANLLRSHVDPFAPGGEERVASALHYAALVRPVAAFDYAAWYRRGYGDRFLMAAGTPCGPGVASRIVRYESERRTGQLAALIDRYAKPGATVVVEAGANHWLALEGWLKARSTAVS